MARTNLGVFSLLIFLTCVQWTFSANILFFWGFSGYSHRIAVWPLIEKLADKGHNVTFFSPHPPKQAKTHPNITDLVRPEIMKNIGMDYHPADIRINEGVKGVDNLWFGYMESGIKLTKTLMKDKDFLKWANESVFDLVIVDALFNDVAYAFAWKWKAPTIMYSPTSFFPWWNEAYGIPEENYPEFHYHLPSNMTFLQEVWNTMTPLVWHAMRYFYYYPQIEADIRSVLDVSDMPSLMEMDRRNALILANSHFSEEYPRSIPPWVVFVGGQHCTDKTKPLSQELQKFIDKWDSVVYFSWGTYMKLPLLPDRIKSIIFNTIRTFPKTGFVMRWSGGEVPKDIPSNVYAAEWLSQQDILANPKVKAFITHGGLLSTQEAIYHRVPLIVFPIFAEQDFNAQRIHSMERGIMLEISELTEEKFVGAIREILTNKKYQENMDQTSRVFRDRPAPVDTTIWHIEYVLRHRNTTFLRPNGLNKTWYQRRMLHIWGFIAGVASVFIIGLIFLLRCIFSTLLRQCRGDSTDKLKIH